MVFNVGRGIVAEPVAQRLVQVGVHLGPHPRVPKGAKRQGDNPAATLHSAGALPRGTCVTPYALFHTFPEFSL